MFSKWFKDTKGVWQRATIPDEQVEALRIQSVSDDLELFKKILSMVKEKLELCTFSRRKEWLLLSTIRNRINSILKSSKN